MPNAQSSGSGLLASPADVELVLEHIRQASVESSRVSPWLCNAQPVPLAKFAAFFENEPFEIISLDFAQVNACLQQWSNLDDLRQADSRITVFRGHDLQGNEVFVIGITSNVSQPDGAISHPYLYQTRGGMPDSEKRQRLWDISVHGDIQLAYDVQVYSELSKGMTSAAIRNIGLCAQWFSTLSCKRPWRMILQSIIEAQKGNSCMMCEEDIDQSTRIEISKNLIKWTDMTIEQIARVIDIDEETLNRI